MSLDTSERRDDSMSMEARQNVRISLAQQEAYWRNQLGDLPGLDLPSDHPRLPLSSFMKASESIELDEHILTGLQTFCAREHVTLFTMLLAACKALLLRYTGHEDICVGSVSSDSSREHAGVSREVFVNPIGLRTSLAGNPSVQALVKRVTQTIEEAAQHRDYPFEGLVEALHADGDLTRAPIFQVMLVLCHVPFCLSEAPISSEHLAAVEEQTARCDLVIVATEAGQGLSIQCDYDAELFEVATIRRLLGHFQTVLEGMVAHPEQHISTLPLATADERHHLLVAWNTTQVNYPRDVCLHQLFETQVERSPDAIALVFENETLTYGDLNRRANQVAHHLRRLGVQPEVLVGIYMERSLEMVIGLYGILKAGGAYVPLDPEYPPERVAFMVQDAQVPVLLTQERFVARLPEHNAQVVCLDADWATIAMERTENPVSGVTSEHLAYVIYTSGSTGRPKGVMNAHMGICNRLLWMQDAYTLTAADRVLQKTPFSFDVSVWEFFWPLCAGARLVVTRPGGHRDNTHLVELIVGQEITTLHFVPSMLQVFLEAQDVETCQSLKRVICSGEALPYELQERFFTRLDAELHNLYGPTEAAIDVTYWACQPRSEHHLVPIGRPVANTQIYLLDPQLQPVPSRVPGELHIGGVQVARGYLNRPELTAEKFIPDPFGHEPHARLYKTGDLARYLPDGNIEFLGRIDDQVKLRGFRIELGEVEAVLAQHLDVRESVVLLREDQPGDKRLVAYVVPSREHVPSTSALQRFLREKLPEYMVPAAFVSLAAMPLTPNGKIDRHALPVPEGLRPQLDAVYVMPQSEVEQRIAAVWQEVLQVENVGIHDNFFDLGGHSLLLGQVRVALQDLFGQDLLMPEMFQYPTIDALAKRLRQASDTHLAPQIDHERAGRRKADDAAMQGTDIAIIGMACRFPGAENPEAFWQNLCDAVESVSFFSDEELISAGVDPALLQNSNYVKASAVLPDIERFDASFFDFSPREAELMDPQHRLFLECAWEVMERAGYHATTCDTPIGVYAGVGMNTYVLNNLHAHSEHSGAVGAFQVMLGNDKDFLPTRVSYKLNLKGPSVNVQTACSTSLVAMHMACQGLLKGECDMALAGGVSAHVPQKAGYVYQEGMILSPDGHCRAFDARAQGTVFGNGVGIVVLKRLADAIADGDCIHAVIKGSAINNDGSVKVGYTAPSVDGQASVIAKAQAIAGIEAETVTYIETHGTGTALGDPIEIAALTQAFRPRTQKRGFCAIGAVKTNIGHLDAAAGVAGLIKTVLALQHKMLPPSLHFEQPNPQIDFADSPFYVNTTLSAWHTDGIPRRAGVNSFGIGGTNCHVVLEEAPETTPVDGEIERPWHILTLSAKSDMALRDLVQRYEAYLMSHAEEALADVCFTANTGRAHFDHRLAVVADASGSLGEQLGAFAAGTSHAGLVYGALSNRERPQIAFLFTGQGAQWLGMGHELYDAQPVFRQTIDRCDALLRPYLEQPLLQVLYPESGSTSPLDETVYTQPALFALEYALAELWRSWGIEPAVVMGHSVGEYVAACVAGVFSLEDGVKLIAERGRLMQALPQDGEMVSVFADEARVAAALQPYVQEVSIAAVNGPEIVVISGKREAVQAVTAVLQAEGIKVRALTVSHAFHSPLMEPMLAAFERVTREVRFSPPSINFISNVTGGWVTTEVTTPEYWCRHVRQPVRFAAGMETLHQQGYEVFLEIGPQPTLVGMGRHCLPKAEGIWLPSLRRGQSDWQPMLQSLAALYVHGMTVNWVGFDQGYVRRRLPLPTYPFQRQRYWVEPAAAHRGSMFAQAEGHPLVGQRLRLPMSKDIRFEAHLSPDSPPYLKDHKLFGTVVVSGSTDLAIFLAAVEEAFNAGSCVLEELFFLQPLVLLDQRHRTVQVILVPQETGEMLLQFVSLQEGADANANADRAWTIHVTGHVRTPLPAPPLTTEPFDATAVQARCPQVLSGTDFYANVWVPGLDTGPAYRWIETLWWGDGDALCQTALPPLPDDVSAYPLHPGLIEACFQILTTGWKSEIRELAESGYIYVPFSITSLRFYGRPRSYRLWCHAQLREHDRPQQQSVTADLHLFDEDGQRVADILGFEVRKLSRDTLQHQDVDDGLYYVDWQPQALASQPLPAEPPGRWLIFAGHDGMGAQLAALLHERGEMCILVSPGPTYKMEDRDHYQVNPAEPEDIEHLLEETPPCRGVVFLWGLEAATEPDTTLITLQHAQALGCESVLHLVQAAARASWPEVPRLWLVTRGTQAVGAEPAPLNVQQAPLWGLARVIALEHPELRCVRLDMAPRGEADDCQAVFEELRSADPEDQIAYRQGVRYVARLVPYAPPALVQPSPLAVDGESSYLITGGLGALGLKVAQGLVEHGARHLVLTGRRGATDAAQKVVHELEQAGAHVLVAQADVSQSADVARVLETVTSSMPPLRGVVHAAGVLDDGILLRQNVERFRRVMAPKVAGTWNLHTLTQEMALDFFVCFSSTTALLGAQGQGNYAAANAFMDALASYRRAQGLPGLSINWGPWSDVGMAAEVGERDKRRMRDQGWAYIAPERGVRVLGVLLAQRVAQVGVLPVNWSKFVTQFPADRVPPLLTAWARPVAPSGSAERLGAPQQTVLARLQDVPVHERRDVLAAYVESEVAGLLGLEPSRGAVPLQQGFADMGMDSLMGVELRARLQNGLGLSLASTFAFDYSNIADVTAYLSERLTLDAPSPSVAEAHGDTETSAEVVDEVPPLSEDGLNTSIEDELAKLEAALQDDQEESQ